jgi:uncharacterized protein YceK
MKMIITTAVCLLVLSGCGMTEKKPDPQPAKAMAMPEQELLVDDKVYAMSRLEVMNAIGECQTARTRAVVIYGKRKVGGVTRDIVVDVSCAPLY